MTGKGRGGEYQREALIRVRNIGDHSMSHEPGDSRRPLSRLGAISEGESRSYSNHM